MFVYPYLKGKEIKYKGKSLKLGKIPMDFCPACKNFEEEEIIPHCSISSEPIEVYVGEKRIMITCPKQKEYIISIVINQSYL